MMATDAIGGKYATSRTSRIVLAQSACATCGKAERPRAQPPITIGVFARARPWLPVVRIAG